MSKKAQGLSISTVVLAILATLILAVFIYLFVQQIDNVGEATRCSDEGGVCIDVDSNCIGNKLDDRTLCTGDNRVCCVLR